MKKTLTLMLAMFVLNFASASAQGIQNYGVNPQVIKYEGDAPVPPQQDPEHQNHNKKKPVSKHRPQSPEQPQHPGQPPQQ